ICFVRLRIAKIEFWQRGGEHRLHDRFMYQRQADDTWQIERLCP
ncbi:MAG: pyridoxine 5'-phosphate oxidase C-terminal domain-containing protein, partial [Rheinheimera sp.]|nr:pyridoxine 5'-phosphate oxidase C-terminal domain-containing protein [Rheinheimera sp.]